MGTTAFAMDGDENPLRSTGNGTSREERLLLVEGDSRIADFLVRGLSPLGIQVTVAEDDEVAGFFAATERFDGIVLDLGPPLTSGHDLLRFLRTERAATPVIVLTERDEPEARRAVLDAGASEYITKPFVLEDLRERIRASLGHARPHEECRMEVRAPDCLGLVEQGEREGVSTANDDEVVPGEPGPYRDAVVWPERAYQ
jgi:DNA-binding response OmpR family regulator